MEGAPRRKKKRNDSTSKAVGLWKQSCTRLYKEVRKQEDSRGTVWSSTEHGGVAGTSAHRFSQNAEDPRRLQAPSGLKNRQRENQEAACPTHDLT